MFHPSSIQAFLPIPRPAVRPVISVFGLGLSGIVTAACLADLGFHVIGADADPTKVDDLMKGLTGLAGPGLATVLNRGLASGHLVFSDDILEAVMASDVTILTQSGLDDEDHYPLAAMGRTIGAALVHKDRFHTVILRGPVVPGVTMGLVVPAIEAVSGLKAGQHFGICHSPQVLRDGSAIADFRKPGRPVIGMVDSYSAELAATILPDPDLIRRVTSIQAAEGVAVAAARGERPWASRDHGPEGSKSARIDRLSLRVRACLESAMRGAIPTEDCLSRN